MYQRFFTCNLHYFQLIESAIKNQLRMSQKPKSAEFVRSSADDTSDEEAQKPVKVQKKKKEKKEKKEKKAKKEKKVKKEKKIEEKPEVCPNT